MHHYQAGQATERTVLALDASSFARPSIRLVAAMTNDDLRSLRLAPRKRPSPDNMAWWWRGQASVGSTVEVACIDIRPYLDVTQCLGSLLLRSRPASEFARVIRPAEQSRKHGEQHWVVVARLVELFFRHQTIFVLQPSPTTTTNTFRRSGSVHTSHASIKHAPHTTSANSATRLDTRAKHQHPRHWSS